VATFAYTCASGYWEGGGAVKIEGLPILEVEIFNRAKRRLDPKIIKWVLGLSQKLDGNQVYRMALGQAILPNRDLTKKEAAAARTIFQKIKKHPLFREFLIRGE